MAPRAAASAAGQPKVLRIGVIQGGKIIEERIVRRRETVTVGPSEKAHFVIPGRGLASSRFDLFEVRGEEYALNFTDAMSGRISLEGEVRDLADLRKTGRARMRGKAWQVLLGEQARGKIAIGESTILFQFVPPPPVQPKPQLPAAVRGNLFADAFNPSTYSIVLFMIIEAALCIWWANTDWPKPTLEEQVQQLRELIPPRVAQLEKQKAEAETGEEEAEESEEESKEEKNARRDREKQPEKSADEIARERAEKRARLAEQLAQTGINKILGAMGGDGAIADVMRGGDVGADQDELFRQVNGVGVATGETGALLGPAGGKGSGEAADVSQIKVGGDRDVATAGPGAERKVAGRVSGGKSTATGGTGMLNPEDVSKEIKRRMGAIRGCYEQALKRNPTLQGKIVIEFTISGIGRVSRAKCVVDEVDDPAVCSCIESTFLRFRFPPPEGGEASFENPFVFTPAG